MPKLTFKKTYPILITILIFVGIYFLGKTVPEENIRTLVINAGPLAPLVFMALNLLTYVIAPLSGTPFLFIGFYAFGPMVVFYSFLATFLAAIINFFIARKWGRPLVEKFIGKESMNQVDKLTKNYGLWMVFLLRIFQGGVGDYISYAAGLTSLKFHSYFIVSTLGYIPSAILWYFLSQKVQSPTQFTILTTTMAVTFSVIFILASMILKKVRKN